MAKKLNPDVTATDRTLRLYTKLLFSGNRLLLVDLAEQFACSKSTILKTMRVIESSGIAEIATGLEGNRRWFQLKHLPETPHIGLTNDEVEKLALCRDMLERLLPEGIEKVISQGIAKVSTLMSQSENRGEVTTSKACRISWGRIAYSPDHQLFMERLLKAISTHTVCAVEYREMEYLFEDRSREPVQCEFIPVRLTTEEDTLNVEGWRVAEKGTPNAEYPITLAVHRISACDLTRRSLPECPPLPEHEGAFGLVGYKAFPVRVTFSEEFANFIRERTWSDNQEIIDLPDGEIELRFMAADEGQLVGWVLSFGMGAELLEPEYLREWLLEEAQELVGYYSSTGGTKESA
jgi:hypothetical protein